MIAQQLGAEYPDLLRRIILLGTGPRGGEGMVFDELSADELDDTSALLMKAFFTQSEASQASGRAYMERLKSRNTDRDTPVSKQSALAELAAIREWGVIPASDRFAMLGKIQHPTLIVHGNKDVVVMPINAFLLAEQLPNAQLIMYPDCEPWRTISARGCFSSACEVVSPVTARSISFQQGNRYLVALESSSQPQLTRSGEYGDERYPDRRWPQLFLQEPGPKDAQPIVLHHGWPPNTDDWDAQYDVLPLV